MGWTFCVALRNVSIKDFRLPLKRLRGQAMKQPENLMGGRRWNFMLYVCGWAEWLAIIWCLTGDVGRKWLLCGSLGFRLPLLPNARSKNKALRVIK
jgi:hypothetical protein